MTTTTNGSTTTTVETLDAEVRVLMAHSRGDKGVTRPRSPRSCWRDDRQRLAGDPAMTKREPWQDPPVHPAADMLPMMSDAELADLAADIKANGLLEPIVVWVDNTEAAKGSEGPFPTYLLDGRNRLAALKRLGITDPHDAPKGKGANYVSGWAVKTYSALVATSDLTSRGMSKPKWRPDVNPITFVLSR